MNKDSMNDYHNIEQTTFSHKHGRYMQTLKIIIIGDTEVGKTSLLLKLVENNFSLNRKSTIGVDLKVKFLNINGDMVKLQIWDTAGQERFRSIIKLFYTATKGIIMVFDLTNRESFNNLDIWIDELKSADKEKHPIILLGNKRDLEKEIVVSDEEIIKFMENRALDISYFEVSAKNDNNIIIEGAFIHLVNRINNSKVVNEITYSEKVELTDESTFNCCTIM